MSEYEMSIGVGDGSGQLFVHGNYDSIKAVQRIILENSQLANINLGLSDRINALRAENARLTQERDEFRADYLRRNKDVGDRYEQVLLLRAELEEAKAVSTEWHKRAFLAEAENARLRDVARATLIK